MLERRIIYGVGGYDTGQPNDNVVSDEMIEVPDDFTDTIEAQALAAMQDNRDFLALDPPTNAQILAQVKALTRQNNGIIRLILRRVEGTD